MTITSAAADTLTNKQKQNKLTNFFIITQKQTQAGRQAGCLAGWHFVKHNLFIYLFRLVYLFYCIISLAAAFAWSALCGCRRWMHRNSHCPSNDLVSICGVFIFQILLGFLSGRILLQLAYANFYIAAWKPAACFIIIISSCSNNNCMLDNKLCNVFEEREACNQPPTDMASR